VFIYPSSKNRPYHHGLFPMEALPRDDARAVAEIALPKAKRVGRPKPKTLFGSAVRRYRDLFAELAQEREAKAKAPLPDGLERRLVDIKGLSYFMNAAQVGVCDIPESAWLQGIKPQAGHSHAIVLLIEHGRMPETDNLAYDWVNGAIDETGEMRATEIAVCLARHIRHMGYKARADVPGTEKLEHARLSVLAGLNVRVDGELVNPFIENGFSLAVVSTDYVLPVERPLSLKALNKKNSFHYWWGIKGARSGSERKRREARLTHLSSYPMEIVKRVDEPTTLILEDEVPRVPKRAAFFERAVRGDLGEKTKKKRLSFATKHPFSAAMQNMIASMVPYQEMEVNSSDGLPDLSDAEANAKAVKSLSYFLGSDLTGICEIPEYAWSSHNVDGSVIVPKHRYAIVMLIDQEFDTMEGASGDDWISGAQSMRGYLRGAEIAGIMGETLAGMGMSSRTHTQMDSLVLHIPLLLWAGLGELSRIGELVLNPLVGPRFKSVVLTTDLPMVPDKPIDFGLQYFCNNCWKCARECPCDAIPWGDKVMFNGYEIWKPDVERCARYRLTNSKGSACGRCMKTCPLNKVIESDGPILQRMASYLGIKAFWLKPVMVPLAAWLDDVVGNGKRNPAKKWWFDHEMVDGVAVEPAGTNQRDIDPSHKIDPARQKMATYNANMMPPPDHVDPFPVNRKEALAATTVLETPAQARTRKLRGGRVPIHYRPTRPLGKAGAKKPVKQWYEEVK
jgi:ferredoxin